MRAHSTAQRWQARCATGHVCRAHVSLMSFTLDMVAELRIPSWVLWRCSVGALLSYMKLRGAEGVGVHPHQR
jgi:hypothetical protein